MPRLFVPPALIGTGELRLSDEPHRYLARVLRLRAGDAVTVFDGAGTEIDARVLATDAQVTVLALGARRTIVVAGARVVLLQAIPKGERMDLLVQKTTELGIHRICPVVTARTVVQPGGKNRVSRWRTIAQEAARQCGRADLPVIDEPQALAEALRGCGEGDRAGARLMAWEAPGQANAKVPLRKALTGDEPAVTLLVGAEGGFSPEEAEAAVAAGFRLVGLGPRILRSETAAIVAVALVQAALGALDDAPEAGGG